MAQPSTCDHCGQPDPRFWLTDTETGATMAVCPAGLFEYTEAVARQYADLAETPPAPELADDTDRATLPETAPSTAQDAPGPDDETDDDEDRAWEASARRKPSRARKGTASPQEGNGNTATAPAAAPVDAG